MAGRPRTPIAVKMARGDTRKIGARQFAEQMAGAYIAQRGAPPSPDCFEPQELPGHLEANPEAVAQYQAIERRRARASAHYDYLLSALSAENLLCHLDQGLLVGLAWDYALMIEAGERGDAKAMGVLRASYLASANVTGLNESARVKVAPPTKPTLSAEEVALADGLPPGAEAIQ